MAQNDMLKRYLDAGMAFTQMTRDRAELIVKDLVKAGEIRRKEAEQQIEELLDRSRKNTDELLEIIRKEIADQLRALGLDDLAKKAQTRAAKGSGKRSGKAEASGGEGGGGDDEEERDPDATPKPRPVAEPAPEEDEPADSPATKKAAKAAKAAKKAAPAEGVSPVRTEGSKKAPAKKSTDKAPAEKAPAKAAKAAKKESAQASQSAVGGGLPGKKAQPAKKSGPSA